MHYKHLTNNQNIFLIFIQLVLLFSRSMLFPIKFKFITLN